MALTLNLNKLPWYGQVGLFALLGLAAAGGFYSYYASAAQASIAEREARLMSLRADIQKGTAAGQRLPEFRRQIGSLEAQLEQLRAVLPEEQDVADLLRRVQSMATQSNLTILGFTPRPVAKRQMHMEWPIGLRLEGRYHDLGGFLERVSKFSRIINVGDVTIVAKGTAGGPTVTAELTATTFVLIESPATARPAAAAPGKAE